VSRSLDELLAPDLLAGLTDRALEDVRQLRDDLQRAEGGLSFTRRMIHGRLDIVGAELKRRRDGGDPHDLSGLIAQLPDLLADPARPDAPARSPRMLEVATVPDDLAAELDAIVDTDALADLREQDDETLTNMTTKLVDLERWVSERRHALQERVDEVQADVVRRYREGEATVDGLLE
jgi:hypothetical protein